MFSNGALCPFAQRFPLALRPQQPPGQPNPQTAHTGPKRGQEWVPCLSIGYEIGFVILHRHVSFRRQLPYSLIGKNQRSQPGEPVRK